MKKLILIILILQLINLIACVKTEYIKGGSNSSKNFTSKIVYIQDTRTNLCFAWSGQDTRTLTNVPCTEEVMKLIY